MPKLSSALVREVVVELLGLGYEVVLEPVVLCDVEKTVAAVSEVGSLDVLLVLDHHTHDCCGPSVCGISCFATRNVQIARVCSGVVCEVLDAIGSQLSREKARINPLKRPATNSIGHAQHMLGPIC